jgi:hypothetical protein
VNSFLPTGHGARKVKISHLNHLIMALFLHLEFHKKNFLHENEFVSSDLTAKRII